MASYHNVPVVRNLANGQPKNQFIRQVNVSEIVRRIFDDRGMGITNNGVLAILIRQGLGHVSITLIRNIRKKIQDQPPVIIIDHAQNRRAQKRQRTAAK